MISNIYKGNYKLLIIPPIILILIAVYFIPQIKLGVDFTGGTLITLNLNKEISADELKTDLGKEGVDANVRVFQTTLGYKTEIEIQQAKELLDADKLKTQFNELVVIVEELEVNATSNASNNNANADISKYLEERKKLNAIANQMFELAKNNKDASIIGNLNELRKETSSAYNAIYANYREFISKPIEKYVQYSSISIQSVSPALSARFIEKAGNVVLAAGILSVIFVYFKIGTIGGKSLFNLKSLIPSAAVIIGAGSDITIALGSMGAFGIPLTLASFAALMMLVGFSLDTDILLTMRMLGRTGDNREKAFGALKTGVTMSFAAIVAFSVLFIVATLTHIATYLEISSVALFGLVADLIATWGINAVLLLWYVETQQKRHS